MTQSGEPRALGVDPRDRSAVVVTAAGVFAFLVAQRLVVDVLWLLGGWGTGGGGTPADGGVAFLHATVTELLPFGVGVLLCLWFFLPITPELRLRGVLGRGVLAATAGALLVAALAVILALVAPLGGLAGLGGSAPELSRALGATWTNVLTGVLGAVTGGIARLPLVVLAAVLLWSWQRRASSR